MGYVCIHGHFYQPPRENPWLEAIELQDSAYPYHDWNERITAECYATKLPRRGSSIALGAILEDRKQLPQDQFRFRSDAAFLAETRAQRFIRRFGRRPGQPGKFLGTRLGGRAGVQPHDHAVGESARQASRRSRGASGISSTLWTPPRRHVASGNRGGHRDSGDSRRAEHSLYDSGSSPGAARFQNRRAVMEGRQRRADRSLDGLRLPLPSGRTINLFFYDGPISRAIAFEEPAREWRRVRRPADVRFCGGDSLLAGIGSCRGRWRDVRASPQIGRNDPGVRAGPRRSRRPCQAHQLRENTWNGIRRSTAWRLSRTPRGVASTALSVGEATVAAIRAVTTGGIRSGANLCARLWIGCATR